MRSRNLIYVFKLKHVKTILRKVYHTKKSVRRNVHEKIERKLGSDEFEYLKEKKKQRKTNDHSLK